MNFCIAFLLALVICSCGWLLMVWADRREQKRQGELDNYERLEKLLEKIFR